MALETAVVRSARAARAASRPLPHDGRTVAIWLAGLLAVDSLFIGADVLAGSHESFPERLHVYRDRGIPELFQYSKWLLTALVTFAIGARALLYRFWTGIFLYLLADDALSIHENIGRGGAALLPASEILGLPVESRVVVEAAYMLTVAAAGLSVLRALLGRTADPPLAPTPPGYLPCWPCSASSPSVRTC